ncbi:YOL098C [Zygosaccharomyces parabailii]|uniref:BN860_11166g1_1 n=1 Tax=Zygosaccharomyces bailii (strain CLIB 213 / ATCC 58445 / CBS 680 / BCRC 21525 / NBRC 1098 / NCYC 1416 / NRRL Y-2227) TaxID=1333698 RepID=A0A8J2SZ89_ZYGB2|nr:YOL098C [Zygosaccharomyces parabailii]CDF87643.1 BN860_11166g1_1 [Zygosaccharomyces bailii CLIB 213]CDH15303.1 related to zinc metalloprotease [Zygosaccharomyces bailii ISA1307]SJM83392.1 related to zinc metalloprotease [Zygosaccharomyces bailii]
MGFNKLISVQLDYAPQYHLTKYVSTRTRLQLVHINHKSSPLVQGYFAVATECATDSGAPHTLEHLVFMGSQKYPYKGLLDTAGNLCMSSTNAWTATDQTVYTLTTAGWQGFKKLLPAYLDHILHPTLSDEACLTEVHYIDPEDMTDKGVVYSEMEAIETQSWFVTMLEKQKLLFPQGSGYRSETGGLTTHLRHLSNEDIRKFHKNSYSPENLCIIISGNLPEEELLSIVQDWDNELPTYDKTFYQRPFLDTESAHIPARLSKSVESTVEFPESDESQGELLFAWIGEPYHSYRRDLAVSMLMDYFTETALAPFTKQLVEVEDPFANSVDYWTDDFVRTIINLNVHGVPTEKLQLTKSKTLEVLSTHRVDLGRIRQVIDNAKWDYVLKIEKNGDTILSQAAITDFIYGHLDGSSLESTLKDLTDFDSLLEWSQEMWQDLLQETFVTNKPVIVVGKPSVNMNEQLEMDGAHLIKQREKEYGFQGKAKLREELKSAVLHNDKPIPVSLLQNFTLEDPSKTVDFISTRGITTIDGCEFNDHNDELTSRVLGAKPENFPFFLHLEHYPTQFVELHALLNSTSIKDASLLPFYHVLDEIFSMPMKLGGGKLIPYEDVISKLQSETIDAEVSLGLQATAPDLINFRIRCKAEDYAKAVEWIKHCLFDMVFDESRVRVLLDNYLTSIVEVKREGDLMLESLTGTHLYTERSVKKSVDPLFVEDKLERILEEIDQGKYEERILPKLELIRSQLRTTFSKHHLLILADVTKIGPDIYKPWESLAQALGEIPEGYEAKIPPSPRLLDAASPLCKAPGNKAFIITTPASESSYMNIITSIPFNLDYRHPDYAAVSLAAEYLQSVEGPFWKGIRGTGLAYGASMMKMTEVNALGFNIYRGADIIKCYQVAKQIVDQHASGEIDINPQQLEGAISMIINSIASVEKSYVSAAVSKYIDNFILQRGPNFNEYYLDKLSKVTIENVQIVLKKYFVNLFDCSKSVAFISCHPSKLESFQEFLEKEGFVVEVQELEEDEEDEEESD